mgnify:CR=1 FL=1
MIAKLLKLKFFNALAQAPIFSDNWGLCKIKVIFLNEIKYLRENYLYKDYNLSNRLKI